MLTVVLILNCVLAAFCFYIAGQVWQFRNAIAQATEVLTLAEQATQATLQDAPDAILQGQIGSYQLRQSYHQLEGQLRQAEKALSLLGSLQGLIRLRRGLRPSIGKSRSPQSRSAKSRSGRFLSGSVD
jgi:predicted PurR-regulated permease PerM